MEAASLDAPAAIENQLDGLRIDSVFFDEDALRQRRRRVLVEHRDRCLENDGAAIELAGDQMNRRAADADAVRKCLRLRIHARKGREQRGMNVQYGVREFVEQRWPDQPHEPRQADERHSVPTESGRKCGVVLVARAIRTVVEYKRRNGCGFGAEKSARIRPVGDYDGDASLESATLHGIDERLQVASASGDEYADGAVQDGLTVIGRIPRGRHPRQRLRLPTAPGSPASVSIISARSSSASAQTITIPMPMLNVRSMSSSGTCPAVCRQRKSGGHVHASSDEYAALSPPGTIRGRLSVSRRR